MKKTYHIQYNIGNAKYVVRFHDGVKTHHDGSQFFDIHLFKNKKRMGNFITFLAEQGYVEQGYGVKP